MKKQLVLIAAVMAFVMPVYADQTTTLKQQYRAACINYNRQVAKRRLAGGVIMPKLEKRIAVAKKEKDRLAQLILSQAELEVMQKPVASVVPPATTPVTVPVTVAPPAAIQPAITLVTAQAPAAPVEKENPRLVEWREKIQKVNSLGKLFVEDIQRYNTSLSYVRYWYYSTDSVIYISPSRYMKYPAVKYAIEDFNNNYHYQTGRFDTVARSIDFVKNNIHSQAVTLRIKNKPYAEIL